MQGAAKWHRDVSFDTCSPAALAGAKEVPSVSKMLDMGH